MTKGASIVWRRELLLLQTGIRTVGRGGGGKHLDVPLKLINICLSFFRFLDVIVSCVRLGVAEDDTVITDPIGLSRVVCRLLSPSASLVRCRGFDIWLFD